MEEAITRALKLTKEEAAKKDMEERGSVDIGWIMKGTLDKKTKCRRRRLWRRGR